MDIMRRFGAGYWIVLLLVGCSSETSYQFLMQVRFEMIERRASDLNLQSGVILSEGLEIQTVRMLDDFTFDVGLNYKSDGIMSVEAARRLARDKLILFLKAMEFEGRFDVIVE